MELVVVMIGSGTCTGKDICVETGGTTYVGNEGGAGAEAVAEL